jgi:transketolase
MISDLEHQSLLKRAISIKRRFMHMYKSANAGHIGSSLSCAEILTFIQFGWKKENDELILSKGHAAAALYSTLAEAGLLTEEDISTFYKNATLLAAHPPASGIKGISFATGSLGHGLSLAAGFGLASRLKGTDKTIFCVTSDGELNEGSTWEAAQFIAHHKLTNVVWFIDYNKLQGFGSTAEVMGGELPDAKLKAFGFEVYHADGHSFRALSEVKSFYSQTGKPMVIVCNTVKGNGWEAWANKLDSHYLPIDDEQFAQVIARLNKEQEEADINYPQSL